MKRKATIQEVFDELENIIKQAKTKEQTIANVETLREDIIDHLQSIERKLNTKTLEEDWLPFKVEFHIETVTKDEYAYNDTFEARDVLHLRVKEHKTDLKLNIDYEYLKSWGEGDHLNSVKLSGDKPTSNEQDIANAVSFIIANYGWMSVERGPVDIDDIDPSVTEAVSEFFNL